ncbi:MAG TPA: hypothetical protein VFQ76_02950 [Longimicrobiaceae bacterium]|nr:hypothetical protein [Longimicrobiaceae bacterium]
MVLVPCPDCGRSVSTRAAACPNCGCPPYAEDGAPPAAVLEARQHAVALPHTTQALAPAPPAGVPAAPQNGVPVMRVHTAAASLLHCPKCGSEHVRRLSLIYREGLAVVNTGTAGVAMGMGTDRVAVGGAKTAGTQQSLASMGAAPPEELSLGGPVIMILVGVVLFLAGLQGSVVAAVIGAVVAAGGGMWARNASHFNDHVYPKLHQQWEASYSCTRCAEVFVWQGPAAA